MSAVPAARAPHRSLHAGGRGASVLEQVIFNEEYAKAGAPDKFRDGLGAAFQGGAVEAGPCDSGDSDKLLEPCQSPIEGTVYG